MDAYSKLFSTLNSKRIRKLASSDGEKSFEETVKEMTFKNPETGNDVKFNSLPDEEQKKLRGEWDKKQKKETKKREEAKKSEKANNKDLASKDKGHREKAKKKLLEEVSDIGAEIASTDRDKAVELFNDAFSSIASDYGISSLDEVKDLSEEALDDLISAMDEAAEGLHKSYVEAFKKRNEEIKGAKKKVTELSSKDRDLERRMRAIDKKINSDDGVSDEEYEKLDEEYGRLDKEQRELFYALLRAQEEVGVGEEEEPIATADEMFYALSDSVPGMVNPNDLIGTAYKVKGDKKKLKEMEETKKKEEEEHKKKVKEITKKIGDLISSASSAKDSKEVSDLFAEFGRIKGPLSGGKVFDEVKGDLDKAEKALKDAQENNSMMGKLKSFFKGKKAHHRKVALELLKEEIALLKEQEARRNKKR